MTVTMFFLYEDTKLRALKSVNLAISIDFLSVSSDVNAANDAQHNFSGNSSKTQFPYAFFFR